MIFYHDISQDGHGGEQVAQCRSCRCRAQSAAATAMHWTMSRAMDGFIRWNYLWRTCFYVFYCFCYYVYYAFYFGFYYDLFLWFLLRFYLEHYGYMDCIYRCLFDLYVYILCIYIWVLFLVISCDLDDHGTIWMLNSACLFLIMSWLLNILKCWIAQTNDCHEKIGPEMPATGHTNNGATIPRTQDIDSTRIKTVLTVDSSTIVWWVKNRDSWWELLLQC